MSSCERRCKASAGCTASHNDRVRLQRLPVSGVIAPDTSGSRRRDPSALGPERLRWPGVSGTSPTLKSFPPSQTAASLGLEIVMLFSNPSPRRTPGCGRRERAVSTHCRASSSSTSSFSRRPQGLRAMAGTSPPFSSLSLTIAGRLRPRTGRRYRGRASSWGRGPFRQPRRRTGFRSTNSRQ